MYSTFIGISQKEEEKLKAAIRRESTKRRFKERSQNRSMNSGYLEDDYDEDEGVSIKDLKNQYKQKKAGKNTNENQLRKQQRQLKVQTKESRYNHEQTKESNNILF